MYEEALDSLQKIQNRCKELLAPFRIAPLWERGRIDRMMYGIDIQEPCFCFFITTEERESVALGL